jgi:hypothetical protein
MAAGHNLIMPAMLRAHEMIEQRCHLLRRDMERY